MSDRTVQQYFLLALLTVVGVTVFYILQPFLAPIALAAVFAVVLQPVYQRALKELKGSEALAAFVTLLICLVVLLIPLIFFGVRLLNESQQLYSSIGSGEWRTTLDNAVQTSGPWVERYVPDASSKIAEISSSIDTYAKQLLSWLISNLGVAFSGLSAFFLGLFIFFMTLYYFLRDGARLCRYLVRLSPLADADDKKILARLDVAVSSVVRGKLLIALIQGVFAGVGLAIFGVPNSVIWGLVAVIASLVPPLGTALVLLPAALYVFLAGDPGSALGLILWGVAAGTVDNIIGPKLMSSGTEQHPLLMLLAVLGGIAFFGPVGVFLGPLTVSLFQTLLSIHIESGQGSLSR
ncbi:AI-2E family transporter [Candidatus Kaiserbacteria bacterium]|nr:AI-2E family transporter [Candidatus Kaiserbacteria bacterium]